MSKEKAQQIRAGAALQIEDIRNDKKLTAEAKRQEIARWYLHANASLSELKEKTAQAAASRTATLESSIFGFTSSDPSTAISHRDAQDRAASLDPADEANALNLLRRALTSGDTILAKAIVSTGIENDWADVVNNYSAFHPHLEAKVDELWTLKHDVPGHESTDLKTQMLDAPAYSLPKPTELGGHSESTIRSILTTELDAPLTERPWDSQPPITTFGALV